MGKSNNATRSMDMSPDKKARTDKASFQPPSPSGRFSMSNKKSYPHLSISYDEVAHLAFLEVVPASTKQIQFLGALAFPPMLEDDKKEKIKNRLTSLGIFTLVPKVANGSVIKEEKLSSKGAPYEIFQWVFVATIEMNDVVHHLNELASSFLAVSFSDMIDIKLIQTDC